MSAMAALEASIDFPDEADIPGEIDLTALEPIEALAAELEAALGDAGRVAGRSGRASGSRFWAPPTRASPG